MKWPRAHAKYKIKYGGGILNSSEEARVKNFTKTKLFSQPGLLGATSSWCTISPDSTEPGLKLAIRNQTVRITSCFLFIVHNPEHQKEREETELARQRSELRLGASGDRHETEFLEREREREGRNIVVLEAPYFS